MISVIYKQIVSMHYRKQSLKNSDWKLEDHCAICKCINNQLLMLICHHDPCIECAAKHYFHEENVQNNFQLKRNFHDFYPCEVCFEITKLDPDTVLTLKNYIKNKNKKIIHDEHRKSPTRNGREDPLTSTTKSSESKIKNRLGFPSKTPRSGSTDSSHYHFTSGKLEELRQSQISEILEYSNSRFQTVMSSSPKHSQKGEKKRKYVLCKNHADQSATYYCFNCYKNICPECAIHGSHFGHSVEAIKKAAPKLKKIYNQFLSEGQRLNSAFSQKIRELNDVMQDFSQWNKNQRNNIRSHFHELYDILAEKQKTLMSQINQCEKEGLEILKNKITAYHKITNQLREKRKSLKQLISEDPSHWNFVQLQTRKEEISQIISQNSKDLESKKYKKNLYYLNSQLVQQAIQTIEDLVSTFKLASKY